MIRESCPKETNPIDPSRIFVRDKKQFVNTQVKAGADRAVAGFIANFLLHERPENTECVRALFRSGYCYYFAHMLRTAFNRGTVCWAAPFGHIVWLDDDETPYDVEGLYFGEATDFVPERYLGDAVLDFKHVPGRKYGASRKDLGKILKYYRADAARNQSEKERK